MTAATLHRVDAAGNLREPVVAYVTSRGRLPSPDPLLRQRGPGPATGKA